MERYTISQVAHAAGVPVSTLRYYERVGLVCPTGRAENNYRVYAAHVLPTIHFIRTAQAAGFTLDDIRTLLALQTGHSAVCRDVQPVIARRLAEVSQRLKAMRQVQRLLQSFLLLCSAQAEGAACPVVTALSTEQV